MPQKKYYRSCAHFNPLSQNDISDYPKHPGLIDWGAYYPSTGTSTAMGTSTPTATSTSAQLTVLDVECGFGGLTLALVRQFGDDERVMGIEIRIKVTKYVRLRIVTHRTEEWNNTTTPTTTVTTTTPVPTAAEKKKTACT